MKKAPTKAQMLYMMKEGLPKLNILPIYVVYSDDLKMNEQETIESILNFAMGRKLIVRSSSQNEDTYEYSNAGKFVSVVDVEPEYS